MADTVHAQCGFCKKRFRLRADQLNRDVRCPHCKTVVKITQKTETAEAAVEALRDVVAGDHPLTTTRPGAKVRVGIRSKNVAIVWLALIGVGFIGVLIGLFVVFGPGGRDLMPSVGGDLTGQHFERDTVVRDTAPEGTSPSGGAATSGAGGRPVAPVAQQDLVQVNVERLLRGYKDETVTYAVGHVRNNTDNHIASMKVTVGLYDEDEKPLGEAVAILINIPAKYAAPLVAEWTHEEGVRATRWALGGWETSPSGVPDELPWLEVSDPWPKRDPNSVAPEGEVSVKVTNHGSVAVRDMDVVAVLLDTKGRIVGAAKQAVTKEIKPDTSEEVSIRWTRCAGTLVSSADVWVQPQY
ncbi:MAG TPA: FxLYD domain-containing protein [Phycisphaerae bacterium]|nr:FxLYD domain-containing protein [Phycisphaerae bacterium]